MDERIDKLREQAFAAISARRFAEAADRFREAWELDKDFWDICNLGRAEMDLARWREAAEHLGICLKVMPEDQRPVFGERFERFHKEALAEVGALSLAAKGAGADGRPAETQLEGVPATTPAAVPAPKLPAGASLREPPAPAPPTSVKEFDGRSGASAQGKEQSRIAIFVAGSALGIVGTAVGIGCFWAAETVYDDAQTRNVALQKPGPGVPCYALENFEACSELERTNNNVFPLMALGAGAFALAGAGVAVILYEVVRGSADIGRGGPNTVLLVTPGWGGLGLTGTF